MEIGGYNDLPAWPKMGPSLLIATCLIVAIWTARRSGSPTIKVPFRHTQSCRNPSFPEPASALPVGANRSSLPSDGV